MKKVPLLNYQEHILGLLATGGKPDTDEKLDWLFAHGFQCIISLEGIPDQIRNRIFKKLIGHFSTERDAAENDERIQKDIINMIAAFIVNANPVYMHCSAGIKLSPSLARRFIAKKNLYIANYLGQRANDLNHGDDFDWSRGHEVFVGNRINNAIQVLEQSLDSEDNETKLAAADTLAELMEHADHNCFNNKAEEGLKQLLPRVRKIVFCLNRGHQEDYRKVFARFTRHMKHRNDLRD